MPEPLRLRLFENYRFVLYAPFYAAHATGAYAAEGLEVELLPSPGPGKAEAALAAGEIDVLWMGPIRVMKHHDENPDSPLVEFAEVVCRDPFSLVGHEPYPEFRLVELGHMRFASTSEVPTPVLCLDQDMRDAGFDPAWVPRITGNAWRTASPRCMTAASMSRSSSSRLSSRRFPAARRSGIRRASAGRRATPCSSRRATGWPDDPEPFRRMARAMRRTQQWVASEPPRSLAAAIADYFPDLDRSVLTRSLARYKEQGVWASDPRLSRGGVRAVAARAARQRFSEAGGAVRRMRRYQARRGGCREWRLSEMPFRHRTCSEEFDAAWRRREPGLLRPL